MVKNLPARQETWVWSLSQQDSPEEEMATHSSILAQRIPWREEPGGLQTTGLQRVRLNWAINTKRRLNQPWGEPWREKRAEGTVEDFPWKRWAWSLVRPQEAEPPGVGAGPARLGQGRQVPSGSKTAEFVVQHSMLFLTYILGGATDPGRQGSSSWPCVKLHCNCQCLHNQNLSTTISFECAGMSTFPFSTLLGNLREKSSFINASKVIREDILFSRREVFIKWIPGIKRWR